MPTAPLTRAPGAGALDRERQRREARQQRLQAIRARPRGGAHARPRRRRRLRYGHAILNGRHVGEIIAFDGRAQIDELLEGVQNLNEDTADIGRRIAQHFVDLINVTRAVGEQVNEIAESWRSLDNGRWRPFGRDLWHEPHFAYGTGAYAQVAAPFGDLYYADNTTTSMAYRPTPIYSLVESTGYRRPAPPEIRLRVRIVDADFDRHPDPDALLGQTFDDLKRRLEAQIREKFGMTDDVWRAWTFDVTTHHDPNPVADSPLGDWVIEARAINTPPRDDTAAVWEEWSGDVWHYVGSGTPTPEVSVAEMRARAARRAAERARNQLIMRNRQRADRLRRRVAERTARALLVMCLDDVQRADLERANGFRVTSETGRSFWISHGYAGNVYSIDERGHRLRSYCIHTYGHGLPDEDTMLAQKLLLETNESEFLRIANEAHAAGYADLGQQEAEPERELAAA